ncbi:Nitrogen permease regulator 2 [Parelaphostrongylus tenuis]|uniref:Nitrogen permease regulator 2 n=1 Tax=Parelaphostrongylus tenuis TaxID=148309 RepID=A0AAD5WLL8_PARTN|nr:Nitrogen permease regulator 2 [Parelaphostrongylus tenuis]
MGMTNDEYVYIISELGTIGYSKGTSLDENRTVYIWEDQSVLPDGRDNDASKAFLRTFMLSETPDYIRSSPTYTSFSDNVQEKMKHEPFLCDTCDFEHGWKIETPDKTYGFDTTKFLLHGQMLYVLSDSVIAKTHGQLGLLAHQLYDALLIYATVVNETLSTNTSFRDGRSLFRNTVGEYEGLLSNITIARNGARIPEFSFFTLNRRDFTPLIVAHITTNTEGEMRRNSDQHIALCGDGCLTHSGPWPTALAQPPRASGGSAASSVQCLVVPYNGKRSRTRERERLDALWKIPFVALQEVTVKQCDRRSRHSGMNPFERSLARMKYEKASLSSDFSCRTLDVLN